MRLGSIDLQDFEVPRAVRFGGRHQLNVHVLAGGRRIVERLGPDDTEIQFRGTFSGPAAELRARAFDNVRLSGEIVWLTWDSFRRQVIIKASLRTITVPGGSHIRSAASLPIRSEIGSAESTSIAAIVSADLGSAMSAAAGSAISMTPIQAALSTSNALTAGTAGQTQAIAAVGSAIVTIKQQIDQQSATLISPIPSSTGLADLGQSYVSKVNCAASLAAAINVGSYVGRIGVNIAGSGV